MDRNIYRIEDMFSILGNGDMVVGKENLSTICHVLEKSREIEKEFSLGKYDGLGKVGDAYYAFEKSVEKSQKDEEFNHELLNLFAVCVRMYNKEFIGFN